MYSVFRWSGYPAQGREASHALIKPNRSEIGDKKHSKGPRTRFEMRMLVSLVSWLTRHKKNIRRRGPVAGICAQLNFRLWDMLLCRHRPH